jgi:hypothetical protein
VKYSRYKKIYSFILAGLFIICLIAWIITGRAEVFLIFLSIGVLAFPWLLKDLYPFEDIKQPKEYLNDLIDGLKNDGVDVVNEALSSLTHPFMVKREKEKNELLGLKATGQKINIDLKRDEADLENIKAEVDDKIQETNITKRQIILLDKILNEVQLDNITPAQCLLLVKALDTTSTAEAQILMNNEMISEQLNKMKAETDILKQKARQEKAQSKLKDYDVISEIRADVKRRRASGDS